MRHLGSLAGLAVVVVACLPVDLEARGPAPEMPALRDRLSIGIGYDHHVGDWESDSWKIDLGRIEHNRFCFLGAYSFSQRWGACGQLGIADMKISGLAADSVYPRESLDHGFRPFATLEFSGTPLGVPQGTSRSAIDLLFEFSGFMGHKEELDGHVTNITGEPIPVKATSELKEHWEAKGSALLRVGGSHHDFSCGLFAIRSGARRKIRLDSEGIKDTLAGYIENKHAGGVVFALNLCVLKGISINAQAGVSLTTCISIRFTT